MGFFELKNRIAVIVGASGAIGGAIARGFAQAGADIALGYSTNEATVQAIAKEARANGRRAIVTRVDALSPESFTESAASVVAEFGRIDILVNSGGGNRAAAMTGPVNGGFKGFFDLDLAAIDETMRLNFLGGTVAPCLAYGRAMTDNLDGGAIVNITSMNALRPLEGRPAYAAAKAAVANFTQWLACHLAKEYSPLLRVNAIAPGFFPNERMRAALFNDDGSLSARGSAIVAHTPMGRLGKVEDLVGTAIWYASPASAFVTGTVTPVDGGFNAYAGL